MNDSSMKKDYDIIVVGGGIAGLASAEMLSRGGKSVLLIEKENLLCSLSSGAHHGWFHFGSLYTIFPANNYIKGFVKNLHVLLDYYSHLPGFNLNLDSSGRIKVKNQPRMWLTDNKINYIAASRNNEDFNLKKFNGFINYFKKIFYVVLWEFSLKRFVGRHVSFDKNKWNISLKNSIKNITNSWIKSYNKSLITKHNYSEINLNKDTHFLIEGFDRTMNLEIILEDIYNAYIDNGGKVLNNCEINSITKKGKGYEVKSNNEDVFFCKTVINSSGKNISQLSNFSVTNVESPLLVIYPKLLNENFVRLTPFVSETINHLVHTFNGKEYSLVGGGGYSNSDEFEKKKVLDDLKTMSSKVFKNFNKSKVIESYFSTKTEFITNKGRNYLYSINKEGNNRFNIIPGKFTLSFSLSLDLFKKIYNCLPSKEKSHISKRSSFKNKKNQNILSRPKAVSILSKILFKN